MVKFQKKWLAAVGVLVLFLVIGAARLMPVEVETVLAKKSSVSVTVTEKGRVVADGTRTIYSEFAGTVKTVHVDEGDAIRKGTVLAEFDTSELEVRIAQLEGELKAAAGSELSSPTGGSSQLEQQRLALDEAKSQLKQAQTNYHRVNKLFTDGGATYVELEQAQSNLETKKKSAAQAEAALALAEQQNRGTKLQYQGQKQSVSAQLNNLKRQIQKGKITADRDSIVLTREIDTGDYVNQGSVLFTLGNDKNAKIETYVNTGDMINIKHNSPVTVVFNVPGKDVEVVGRVSKIAPAAEEVQSALGVSEYKVKVTVELSSRPRGIKIIPGMEVDVRLVTQEANNVISVPRDSVFTDANKDYVWAVRKGSAALVPVDKGIEGDNETEIKKGLTENDYVITDPHQTELKEGIRVKSKK